MTPMALVVRSRAGRAATSRAGGRGGGTRRARPDPPRAGYMLLPGGGRRHRLLVHDLENRRSEEDHELAPRLEVLLLLEGPAEERDVAEERHLAHGVLVHRL